MSSEAVDNNQPTSTSPPQKKRKLQKNGNGEMPVQEEASAAAPGAIDEGLYSRQL